MNFRKTTTISIGEKTKPIFESLEKIRPSHLSYSLLLAIAVDEYVKNHSGKNSKITEFDSVAISSKFPLLDLIQFLKIICHFFLLKQSFFLLWA